MQHYTRNTVEVREWCQRCRKETMHRVDGVKLGPCFDCLKRLEKPAIPRHSSTRARAAGDVPQVSILQPSKVKRECRMCGEPFEARRFDVKRGYGKFCSRTCGSLRFGTKVDTKGYLSICAGPQRYIRVATLIAEAKLGRKLRKDEQAHHKDGNKLNCDPGNIVVLDEKTHGYVSSKQKWFVENKLHAFESWQWEQWVKEASLTSGSTDDQ